MENLQKKFEDLGDVFMAHRRLSNGERFGLVRFKNVRKIQIMERRLNEVWIVSFELKAFVANNRGKIGGERREADGSNRFHRTDSRSNGRSFSDVLKGRAVDTDIREKVTERGKKENKGLAREEEVIGEWVLESNVRNKLNKCLIGKVESLDNMEAVQALCTSENLAQCCWSQDGDLEDYKVCRKGD